MKESEKKVEESFFSSVASVSQYSDVYDDYEQIMRGSKDLGPTTQTPPINKFEKSENNEDNENNENNEKNENDVNNETNLNDDNLFEDVEEHLNNDNNINIKNSLPIPQDENSLNKNENLFNEKRNLTSSIKEVENESEEILDNDNNNYNSNHNINEEKKNKSIKNFNSKSNTNININNSNKINKSIKDPKKKEDNSYLNVTDNLTQQIKSDAYSTVFKKTSFIKNESDMMPSERKITFDNNLYPFDNSIDEEYPELKNNFYIKNSKKEPKAKKVEENKAIKTFIKHKTATGIEVNKTFKSKPTFEFGKDSRYFSNGINFQTSISKQMKKRKKNKYDATNILKKAVLLNGRKEHKKLKHSSLAENILDQIGETNPNQLPIDNIKFNGIKIDEINLNYLKKYLRRINVESNIKNQKNKFFKTLIELQNFYIDDTSVWVIKINKEGKYLACGCKSGRIKIYELMGYNYMYFRKNYSKSNVMDYLNFISESPYKTLESHKSDIIDLCWSPFYSNLLLSASFDHSVNLWDINQEGNNCLMKNYDHSDIVTCICFNPVIKNVFISGCLDTFVYLWKFDYYNSDIVNSLEEKNNEYNKENCHLNIKSEANMIPLNKKNSNKKNRNINSNLNEVEQTNNNNTFDDLNKTNLFFESKNKDSLDYFNIEHKITALAYFPDGSKIAVGTEKGRIYVYNTYPKINYNNNFFVSQKKLGFFHDGKKITFIQFIDKIFAIISTSDSYIRLVNMVEGKIIYHYKGYVNKASMTRAYTDLIDDVIIVGGEDGNCCLWNLYDKEQCGKINNYEFFKPFAKELIECNLIAPEVCYVNYIQKILKLTNKIIITSIIINGTSKGRLEILLNIDESLSK